jgi:dTDP-4-amino-4,6-dideoxygalactose transaminase
VVDQYRTLMADTSGVALPFEPEWARSNWQSFCVRLADDLDQREVMQSLLDAGVASRRGIMCSHREPAYQKEPWRSAGSLAESEKAQEHAILLPLFHQMTDEQIRTVAGKLRAAVLAKAPA